MYIKIKRAADFLFAAAALMTLFPLLLLIAALIRFESPGSALFRQRRFGKNGTFFTILKFRTMRADTPGDIPTHMLLDPDFHITKTGRFLRKTSLDEIPQLLNILKGDMSLIGPRPALWNQEDLICEREKYGANVILPGLTGLAQIKGRDELSIEEKASLDGEYAEKVDLFMDVRIFFETIGQVLRAKDVREGAKISVPGQMRQEQPEPILNERV